MGGIHDPQLLKGVLSPLLLALLVPFVLDLAGDTLSLLHVENAPLDWLVTEAAPVVLLLASFFLLYRFAPRRRPRWQAALPGAVLATLLFVAARALFLVYILNVADYDLVYGSLSIIFVLVFWAWLAALILLFGGEIVTHIELMLIEGRPAEELDERHRERAPERRR